MQRFVVCLPTSRSLNRQLSLEGDKLECPLPKVGCKKSKCGTVFFYRKRGMMEDSVVSHVLAPFNTPKILGEKKIKEKKKKIGG